MASGDDNVIEIDGGALEGVRLLLCSEINIHVIVKIFVYDREAKF